MPGESTLDDIALIDSKVHITGRCAYLYRAHFNGDVVVLKLSWTRANRLPEGAVYRALEGRGLSIPTVFHSGLLVENFCGYQLEFLVLQHCGVPIVQHISELRKADRQDSASAVAIKDTVTGCIKEVVETLTMALDFGVLHRDVSAGNLAIKDGKVRIIDWGCAKILERPQDAGLADEISQRWKVDWGATIDAGPHGDPFTGTPLYMSIQMLLRVERRSIFNDIESLFYVILDALSDRERGKIPKDAPGFIFYSDQSAAYMRIGCVSSSNLYLTNFGVNAGNAFVPKDVLDAMHQFLFFERGGFIGDKLQVRAGCDRVVDSTAAAGFMYPATLIRLNELYNEPLKTTQMVSTPTKEQLDDGSPEASHDTMPMAAIAESRLPPPHLDLGRLSLDRGDSGMDPADPFVPGLDIIPEPSAPATSPAASKTRIIKRPRVKQPPPQASGRVLRSMTAGHSAPPAPIDGLNTNTPSTATGASKRGRTETPDDATEQPARNKENKQPRK
ncbi:hypothetical protein IWW47_002764 [Coemansia sp. RSA 2052]|nr:hypothetical protein IWW47_002764 [Coemansia sp. RSA 2052]